MSSQLCPSADLLEQFVANAVGPEDRARVGEHLRGCAFCQSAVTQLLCRTASEFPAPSALPAGGERSADGPVLHPSSDGGSPRLREDRSTIDERTLLRREAGPTRIGKYQVLGVLGKGGMGVVYLAHDPDIEREVAVKILPEAVSKDPVALKRFLQEARAAGKLHHPNTVSIFEVGQDADAYYLVLERIKGINAADWVKDHGAMPWKKATRVIAEACRGLAAAHAVGLIHRDIKPANLMLTEDGSAKVLDFGIAKSAAGDVATLTDANSFIGTPHYMSPEQCRAEPLDARSDLYSLGATYYALLTGEAPFSEITTVVQILFAHCNRPLPELRAVRPELPQACGRIVAKATAKAPAERYGSAPEMLRDLEAALASEGTRTGESAPSANTLVFGDDTATEQRRPKPVAPPPDPASGSSGRMGRRAAIGAVVGGGFAALAGYGLWRRRNGDGPAASLGPPIPLGILQPLTGTLAASGAAVVDAALLAIEEINKAGGVLARPLQAVVLDVKSEPEDDDVVVEDAIVNKNVAAFFGPWTSASRKTIVPVVEKRDHLLVYPLQYEGMESSPNVVYLGATPNQQLLPAAKWAVAFLEKKKFFLVGSDYVYPRAANAVLRDELTRIGASIVGEEYLPLGDYEADAVAGKIRSSGAEAVFNTINGDTNTAFFRALRKAGIEPATTPVISSSIGETELMQLDKRYLLGDYAVWSYFQSIDRPENREFVARFRARYGPQRVINDPMETMYAGVHLWSKAAAAARSVEPAKVRPVLASASYAAPEGEIRIDPANAHAWRNVRLGRIRADGQFDIVWGSESPVEPVVYPRSRTPAEWNAFLEALRQGWGGQWAAPGR